MLVSWNPNNSLARWSNFEDFFKPFFTSGEDNRSLTPRVDVKEEKERFVLTADLPGVTEKDIELKIDANTFSIQAKRESAKEEKTEKGYVYRERNYGTFYRAFSIGEGIDREKIDAEYKNGVLTVTLPKKPQAEARQIPVKS